MSLFHLLGNNFVSAVDRPHFFNSNLHKTSDSFLLIQLEKITKMQRLYILLLKIARGYVKIIRK